MEAELEPWAYLYIRHNTGLTVGGLKGWGSNRLVTDRHTHMLYMCPRFPKVCITPLRFYKRPTLVQ